MDNLNLDFNLIQILLQLQTNKNLQEKFNLKNDFYYKMMMSKSKSKSEYNKIYYKKNKELI